MIEQRVEMAGAVYHYTISEGKAAITGYEGTKMELSVPAMLEGVPVCAIGKKAFFNVAGLYRLYLPDSICALGDWAFAHCRDLEEIYLPQKEYELGKALFMECGNLKRICLVETGGAGDELRSVEQSAKVQGFGSLLAAVCGILDAPYLFQTTRVDDAEWLCRWDARMLTILHEDDMEGYTNLLLCGEEDYGSRENNLEFYLEEKRKRKVRLAFLRLLHDEKLADENRQELVEYLLAHTKDCDSEETWLVLKEEHGDDMDYITLFVSLGCLTLENFDSVLRNLGEEHPQMKAFFMRYKEKELGRRDFFAGLSLD